MYKIKPFFHATFAGILGPVMRQLIPFTVIVILLFMTVWSLLGSGGVSQVVELQKSLDMQRVQNGELKSYVTQLRRRTQAIRNDDRALEKAARDELGMARPNELIFFFEKKSGEKERAK